MDIDKIRLEPGWKAALLPEFQKPYMHELRKFLAEQVKNKIIYPPTKEFFSAFEYTPIDKVKVVILGQDPYHGPKQAHGLCFSVPYGVDIPPSLKNIYKELSADVGFQSPQHGCLKSWANQGVLLLNATLSVESGRAGSHQKKGWEEFTDNAIHYLNKNKSNLVFLLWGSYAQKKGEFIDRKKHLVLTSVHPSPLSAHRGFFGSKHFSKTNKYLAEHNFDLIDWQLPMKANE